MRKLQVGLVRGTEGVIVILSAIFTLIAIYSIFSRYLFDFSLIWIEEVIRFILAWIVFLGVGVLIYHRGHMAMEAIVLAMRPRAQLYVRFAFNVLILIFLIAVLYEGAGLAQSATYQTSPVTGISYYWPYLSLPVGAALAIIQVLYILADDVRLLLGYPARQPAALD